MSARPYCFCELAPLYALGVLGAEEKAWVEQQVQENPELSEELAAYETATATLPYSSGCGLSGEPQLGALKDRLFSQLQLDPPENPASKDRALRQDSLGGNEASSSAWAGMVLRSQEHPWQPHPDVPGVEIAIFHEDPMTREVSGLLRAEAGVKYPAHRHAKTEEIYMLSGELQDGETVYRAGDYIRSLPGSVHSPWTDCGCSFFFRTSLDDRFEDAEILAAPRA